MVDIVRRDASRLREPESQREQRENEAEADDRDDIAFLGREAQRIG